MKKNEIVEVEQRPVMDIEVYREPKIVLDEARKAAQALQDVISKKRNKVMFNGEQYLEFEDWQTIAKFYGLTTKTYDAEPLEIGTVQGAKAKAEVVNVKTGEIIGSASAWCMKDEPNWKLKPWYQLASMAQTRAASKALRNVLSWVVVLAGYKTTPAEEIPRSASDDVVETTHSEEGQESQARFITDKQRKFFYAICKQNNKEDDEIKTFLKNRYKIEHTKDITMDIFEECLEWAKTPL